VLCGCVLKSFLFFFKLWKGNETKRDEIITNYSMLKLRQNVSLIALWNNKKKLSNKNQAKKEFAFLFFPFNFSFLIHFKLKDFILNFKEVLCVIGVHMMGGSVSNSRMKISIWRVMCALIDLHRYLSERGRQNNSK